MLREVKALKYEGDQPSAYLFGFLSYILAATLMHSILNNILPIYDFKIIFVNFLYVFDSKCRSRGVLQYPHELFRTLH